MSRHHVKNKTKGSNCTLLELKHVHQIVHHSSISQSSNCTLLELKRKHRNSTNRRKRFKLYLTGIETVVIVRIVSLLVKFKLYLTGIETAQETSTDLCGECSNCTLLELKRLASPRTIPRAFRSNCTLLELKRN